MTDDRTANLLGALALALADSMSQEAETRAAHGAAAPAAIVSVGVAPGCSIDALARTIGLSHSATVRIVDRLAADGLVERRGGADRRAVGLHLTRRGVARRRAILKGRAEILTRALGPLSEEDRAALTAHLETILGAFTRDRRHADHICRLCDEDVCPHERCPVERAVSKP
ncbi:MarR family winged helix-turn-helix transcriptional regulator [Sediminicurvatus halobius]|nr:MarR family transcriptional regulator [Spiribacter halobius]UEX77642.1 MarR family transcriptional regulator [Spiribacter halobius]